MQIRCRNCESMLRMPDSAAGRKVICPVCSQFMVIPKNAAAARVKPPSPKPAVEPVIQKPPRPPRRRMRSKADGQPEKQSGRGGSRQAAKRGRHRSQPELLDDIEIIDDDEELFDGPEYVDDYRGPGDWLSSRDAQTYDLTLCGTGVAVVAWATVALVVVTVSQTMWGTLVTRRVTRVPLFYVLSLFGYAVAFCGLTMARAVPERAEARNLAFAALGFGGFYLLVSGFAIAAGNSLLGMSSWWWVDVATWYGAALCYTLFLIRMATYVQRDDLAAQAQFVFYSLAAMLAYMVLMIVLATVGIFLPGWVHRLVHWPKLVVGFACAAMIIPIQLKLSSILRTR